MTLSLSARYLQNRTRVVVWLYENVNTRIEGQIVGKPNIVFQQRFYKNILQLRIRRIHESGFGRGYRSSQERERETAREDYAEGRQHHSDSDQRCQVKISERIIKTRIFDLCSVLTDKMSPLFCCVFTFPYL